MSHEIPPEVLACYIDHTLLKPEASADQIANLCAEASQYHFASVCVNPVYVKDCARLLRNSADVAVCTVVGFPLGANTTEVKVYETRQAVDDGAREIDMVINIGAVKSGAWDRVEADIQQVVTAAHAGGALCKVILETALLTDDEKIRVCQLCQAAGADFVKTSTGLGPGGATPEDVALMRHSVGLGTGVKASGGIRTYADLKQMIEAGATRIGASAGVRIMHEAQSQSEGAPQPAGY